MKPSSIAMFLVPIIILILVRLISLGSGAEGFAAYGETNDRGTFIMYYADWCPHCQHAKPLFKAFMKDGYISVNDKRVNVKMIEEKEIDKANAPDIKGYPTFLYSDPAGKIVEYNGPRDANGFLQFLKGQVLGEKV